VVTSVPALDARLLNDWQSGLPLVAMPYAAIARELRVAEDTVVTALRRLARDGAVSRVGAVFRTGALGASTLAALAVPPADLERVAGIVSARPEVNHNYEREHRFNLWFVVAASDAGELAATLAAIARDTGYLPISLPLVDDYWIDLSFNLGADLASHAGKAARVADAKRTRRPVPLTEADRRLVTALEGGLPLTSRPFADLADRAETTEARVLARLDLWLREGVIKRLGVVVRHRALGYTANAMCVWDVPDAQSDALGESLALESGVTLCYRRARARPQWRYNLFCMIHGRDRAIVAARVAELSHAHRLDRFATAVLFSKAAFKQRGARYGLLPAASFESAEA